MKTRRGFTLVELLTAIAIIAILIAMAFLAYTHISRNARADQTRASMELAKSLMNEYVHQGGRTDVTEFFEPWNMPHTARLTTYFPAGQKPPYKVDAPLNMKEGQANRFGPETIATHRFLRAAASIPECGKILNNLPAAAKVYPEYTPGMTYVTGDELKGSDGKFYRLTGTLTTTSAPGGGVWTQAPNITPLIVDGEKNIVLLVPGDGLSKVTQDGIPDFRIVSNYPPVPLIPTQGWITYWKGSPPPPETLVGKPFFASAGPDGDYTTGDDNGYSFRQ